MVGGSTKFSVKHQGKDIHHPPSTIHKWPLSDLPGSTPCPSLSLSFTINPNTNVHQLPISLDITLHLFASSHKYLQTNKKLINAISWAWQQYIDCVMTWHFKNVSFYFIFPMSSCQLHFAQYRQTRNKCNQLTVWRRKMQMSGLFRLNLHCIAGFHNVTKRTL